MITNSSVLTPAYPHPYRDLPWSPQRNFWEDEVARASGGLLSLRSTYNNGSGDSCGSGSSTNLNWIVDGHTPQDGLLNLTDPLFPLVIVTGIYAISATAFSPSGSSSADKHFSFGLFASTAGGFYSAQESAPFTSDGESRKANVSITTLLTAGDTLSTSLFHDFGSAQTFLFVAFLMRMS